MNSFRKVLYNPVEHRKRPAAFKDALGRLIVRRLAPVALFAGREFERDECSATALVRAIAVFYVGHKEFQGTQKKRPEPALFRVGAIEISPFEHADKNSCVRSCAWSGGYPRRRR